MGINRRLTEIKDITKGYIKSFFIKDQEDNAPVDFVVTWVNGEDPLWLAEKDRIINHNKTSEDNHPGRYRAWNSFKYWFRAVEKYCPWVNKVFLVTWGHVPEWLNLDCEKLIIVKHSDFIPEEYLPTFNCNSIELNLFRIKELSEQFVYFNDDVIVARPLRKEEFFSGGRPCHTAVAYPWINRNRELPYYLFYNVYGDINSKNNISNSIKKHPEKWFSHVYGKDIITNIFPYRNAVIPGMLFTHVGVPFLKSSMEKTWEKYADSCDATSQYKFRDIHQITHQIYSLEDIINGNFMPSKNDWGVNVSINDYALIRGTLLEKKTKMLCLFDGNYPDSKIQEINEGIDRVFTEFFPEKSSFEN